MAYPLDSHSAAWALEEMVLHHLRTPATRASGPASFSSAGRFTCTTDDLDTCLESAARARRCARLVGISRRSTAGSRARTKTSAAHAERSLAHATASRYRPRERCDLLILRNAAHRRLAMVVPQLLRCPVLDRFSFWSSLRIMLRWQVGIDSVHRQRTLLKTAKACGTHLLGIASRKPRRSEGCATRPRDNWRGWKMELARTVRNHLR
jgi:hypothetical protein